MSQTTAWFSLALEHGLAVVSLGKAGTADEQLITGGLTAVESLLGPEIGFEGQDGFVIDHKSSIMERFPIVNAQGQKIFAQYLIQAPKKDEVVPEDMKGISRYFIETLAQEIVRSQYWNELQIAAQILSPDQIFDLIMRAYELAHRNSSIRTDETKFKGLLSNRITRAFSDFRFSETLDSIANHEFEGLVEYVDHNKNEFIKQFQTDILARMIQEYPLHFLYTPPKFLRDHVKKFINQELENFKEEQTIIQLNETVEDFFQGNELHAILSQFDIESLRTNREDVRTILEEKVKEKLWKKSPLLGLINPTFSTKENFSDLINVKVLDRVFNEYDLAEILGQVAENLILKAGSKNQLMAVLVSDVFRNLAIRFPGGLPKILWNVITQLFLIYAAETKQDLKKLPDIMEIPDAHWKTLQQRFKEFKPSPIFAIEGSSTDVIKYYQGVQEAISRGFHKFYSKVIWNIEEEVFGVFIEKLVSDTHRTFQSMQNTYTTIKFLNYLSSKNFTYLNPIAVPLENKFFEKHIKKPDDESHVLPFIEWDQQSLVAYYEKRATFEIENNYKEISNWVKSHESSIKRIENLLNSAKTKEAPGWANMRKTPTINISTPSSSFFEKQLKPIVQQVNFVVTVLNEIIDSVTDLKNKAGEWVKQKDSKNLNRFDKERNKVIDSGFKSISKIKDKLKSINSPVEKHYTKISSEIKAELDKASKELEKIWEKEKLKIIKPEIIRGTVSSIDMGKIKEEVLKEESRRFKDDNLLGTKNEFLYAYASTYLFNSLDESLQKRAINMAIFNPKSSKLISRVIESNRNSKDGWENFEFFEKLKDEITIAGNNMMAMSSMLVKLVRNSYLSKDLPLKIFIDKGEVLALELGTINIGFKKWIEEKIECHPRLVLDEQDNDIHVYMYISSRPAVGEIEYLMDAVVLQSFNEQQQDLGLFIETLKMTASTLGELERRKTQNLINLVGTYLTNN
jgi:hypothetical protein